MKRTAMVISILLVAATVMASVFSRQVTVTGTATRLDANTSGERIVVVNQASGSIYLGPSTVTTSGFELKPGASVAIGLNPNETLYGITAGSSYRADVLESGR